MSSLCICGADFSGIERNPYCQIHGEDGTKSKPVSLNCDADHCTPEERAVIETAVTDRLAVRAGVGDNKDIDKIISNRSAFIDAADALIAARAKTND